MKSLAVVLVVAMLTACSRRQVEVQSGPAPASEVAVQMTNNLSQAVNVYVTSAGSDIFLRQVAPNSTETLPVQGVASGTSVTLKARTVDGTRTYTKDNVVLTASYNWQVP